MNLEQDGKGDKNKDKDKNKALAAEPNLNEWDLVNAATFATVNSGIVKQARTPATFDLPNPAMNAAVLKGKWKPWRLVKGSVGEIISIEMPVETGTAGVVTKIVHPTLNVEKDANGKYKVSGNLTISANGLSISPAPGETTPETAFSAAPIAPGKFYFEVTNGVNETKDARCFMGVCSDLSQNNIFYRSAEAFAMRSDGVVLSEAKAVPLATPPGKIKWDKAGDTIGVAIDTEAGKVWFRGTDGKWLGKDADPSTGAVPAFARLDTTKTFYAALGIESKGAASVNFGQTAFKLGALPSGFIPGIIDRSASDTTTNIAGAVVSATISLKQVDTANKSLSMMVEDMGTAAMPAVTITSVKLSGGADAAPEVVTGFGQFLNEKIKEFTHIFHIVDAAAQGEKTMKWMKPKETAYAAADLMDGTDVKNSVLAILNQTEANTSTTASVAQVDPKIIENMPTGANAVLAISPERFTEEVLLQGAQGMVENSQVGDFKISDDKRKVTNTKELSFGPVKLNTKDKKVDLVVNPKIPVGKMVLSVEGPQILVDYQELSFDYQNALMTAKDKVTFSFKQRMFLTKNKRGKDGHHVLFPTLDNPNNQQGAGATGITDFVITMNLDDTAGATAKDKAEGVSPLIIGLIVGGAVIVLAVAGGATYAAMSGSADAGAVDGVANAVPAGGGAAVAPVGQSIYAAFPQGTVLQNLAGDSVYDQIGDPLALFALPEEMRLAAAKPKHILTAGTLPFVSRWAIGFSHLQSMAGADSISDLSMTKGKIKKFAEGNFDDAGIESTVEEFIKRALKPFDWPSSKTWEFVDVELNGALLIYGKIS